MSYALLCLSGRPHDDTSWMTLLRSVLDAATLIIMSVDDEPKRSRVSRRSGRRSRQDWMRSS
jgi:hypothetical protein